MAGRASQFGECGGDQHPIGRVRRTHSSTGGPDVRVFDVATLIRLDEFMAFDPTMTNGVFVGSRRAQKQHRPRSVTLPAPGALGDDRRPQSFGVRAPSPRTVVLRAFFWRMAGPLFAFPIGQ